MFTEKEKKIIQWAKDNSKSRQEAEQALINFRTGMIRSEEGTANGGISQVEGGKQTLAERIGETVKKRASAIGEIATSEAPLPKKIVMGLGEIAGGITEGVVKTGMAGISAAIPDDIEAKAKESGLALLQTPFGQKALKAIQGGAETYAKAKKTNPDAFELLESVVDIASLYPIAKLGAGVVKTGEELAQAGVRGAKAVAGGVTGAAKKTAEIARPFIGEATRIPTRVGTNVAAKQATEESIKALPSKTAQIAARDGVDIGDIKDIYSISEKAKPAGKELAKTVKAFVARETDTDPIEMVGKPIVARIKTLEKAKQSVGKKLGEVSEKLGTVTSAEVAPKVIAEMRKVPGMSGLKVSKKGVLDFSSTTLKTAENAPARKQIQNIFIAAVKSESGTQKHLLRQELFEILGGKKRAALQLTETQDKTYQAVRKALSDVLESKNSSYKALSGQYRSAAQPLSEMRKLMKAFPDATEDILDMNAGILARRLTSTSLSQGQVQGVLNALDKATKIKGTTRETVEGLQKLYNVFDRYYDIAPKTGYQGQTKSAIEGVTGMIRGAIKSAAGETPAVRQKAIESILREVFGD